MSLVALVKTQGIKNLVWIIHITMQEVYDMYSNFSTIFQETSQKSFRLTTLTTESVEWF